jgi:choline dehydrogenase-like flavoprotein
VQRWSNFEFEGPLKEGYAVDWPIRYKDLAPWYSHVEKFTGISGNRDGIPHFPDSEVQKAFEFNCVEAEIKKKITEKYQDRPVIMGRCAHLTEPQDIHKEQGRGQCQARHLCYRGCPFGGYFSSNSATLPWAAKTGNLTMRTHAVVESIIYDDAKGKVTGVRVIDANTKEVSEYTARVIFVNAACLNSNLILLNSKSNRFPNGLGNDNGLLGRYVAFHNYRGNISAEYEGFEDGCLQRPLCNGFQRRPVGLEQGRRGCGCRAERKVAKAGCLERVHDDAGRNCAQIRQSCAAEQHRKRRLGHSSADHFDRLR